MGCGGSKICPSSNSELTMLQKVNPLFNIELFKEAESDLMTAVVITPTMVYNCLKKYDAMPTPLVTKYTPLRHIFDQRSRRIVECIMRYDRDQLKDTIKREMKRTQERKVSPDIKKTVSVPDFRSSVTSEKDYQIFLETPR